MGIEVYVKSAYITYTIAAHQFSQSYYAAITEFNIKIRQIAYI